MPERRAFFDLAAADAVAARTSAQAELAKNLANEILKGPAKFDPKRLKAVGPEGILVLLAAIRQHKAREVEPPGETSADKVDERMKSSSWQHLRKPEPNRWLCSLAAGVTSGLFVVAIGLAIATFS